MSINKTKRANLLRFLKQSQNATVFFTNSDSPNSNTAAHTYAINDNTAFRFSIPAAIKAGISPADIQSDPALHNYYNYRHAVPVARLEDMFRVSNRVITVTLDQVNAAIANSPAPTVASQSSKNYEAAPITPPPAPHANGHLTRTFDAKLLLHVFRLLNRQTLTLHIHDSINKPAYAISQDPKTSETVEALIMAMRDPTPTPETEDDNK
jgi:hypothetical protein